MTNKRKVLGDRITNALIVAADWGYDATGDDWEWIIDQMVRELLGDEDAYTKWVANIERVSGVKWRVGNSPEDE